MTLSLKLDGSVIVEVGGPDQVSYGELKREYARQRGLRRWMIPVPLLTPRLSSLRLGLVTPLYARVGRKLVDSLRQPTVVRGESAQSLFTIEPVGVREAIARGARNEDARFAQARWSDALSPAAGTPRQWGGKRSAEQSGEGAIRHALIKADLVDCMVALCEHMSHAERKRQTLVNAKPDPAAANATRVIRITGNNGDGGAIR